jgi:hypothetical protein
MLKNRDLSALREDELCQSLSVGSLKQNFRYKNPAVLIGLVDQCGGIMLEVFVSPYKLLKRILLLNNGLRRPAYNGKADGAIRSQLR